MRTERLTLKMKANKMCKFALLKSCTIKIGVSFCNVSPAFMAI